MKKLMMAVGLAVSLVLASALSAFAATSLDTAAKAYVPTSPDSAKANLPSGAPSTNDLTKLPAGDVGPAGAQVTRIHSNYANNTNACASCHATHTGLTADLLQWNGETETCMACHDGSAGIATYNVADGKIGATGVITNGGLFPSATSTANSKSMHDVFDGAYQVSAAPGGNFWAAGINQTAPQGEIADKGKFMEEFSCVSCHNPHGNGGNFRILDPNVNGFADLHTNSSANKISWDVVTAPGTTSGKEFSVKVAYNDCNSTAPFYAYLLTGPYPLGIKVVDGTPVYDAKGALTNALAATNYTVDNTKGYTVIKFNDTYTIQNTINVIGNVAAQVRGKVENYLTDKEKVTYINGFSDFCGACHTDYNTSTTTTTSTKNGYGDRSFTKASFTQAKDGTNPLWADANGQIPVYVPSHAVSVQTGTFTQAYRHTVGLNAGADGHGNAANGMPFETRTYYENGKTFTGNYLSCLSCHVAHGTDNTYWQDYADQRGELGVPLAAGGKMLSPASKAIYGVSEVFDTTNGTTTDKGNGNVINSRGSNLKRMPNMAACEGCHGKGLNNQGYNALQNAAN